VSYWGDGREEKRGVNCPEQTKGMTGKGNQREEEELLTCWGEKKKALRRNKNRNVGETVRKNGAKGPHGPYEKGFQKKRSHKANSSGVTEKKRRGAETTKGVYEGGRTDGLQEIARKEGARGTPFLSVLR